MKFYYIAVILAGILLLLNLAGFNTVSTGGILGATGLVDTDNQVTPENFKDSDLYSGNSTGNPGLKLIFLAFIGSGLVLGAFGRAPDIRYGTAALVFAIVGYLTSDLISLFSYTSAFELTWMKNLMSVIVGSSLIALYVSAISFWQGSDG